MSPLSRLLVDEGVLEEIVIDREDGGSCSFASGGGEQVEFRCWLPFTRIELMDVAVAVE
jgi:hypothetical protein